MLVSNCFQLSPQFWSRILFIYNHFSFTSQQNFSGNCKYSFLGKITRECAPHGYVNSFIPYKFYGLGGSSLFSVPMEFWTPPERSARSTMWKLVCTKESRICGWKCSWYQNISIPRLLSAEYAEVIQLLVRRGSDQFWTCSKKQFNLLASLWKWFLYQ